ncbi:hypothetical protein AVEN_273706-1 [Araneus ventricosus]|uniref:Uncharacterized protein n=1 Tax=Araneus ventricosus TaxID=182803 RepID=A0A4Y2QL08_ARAVE|nr:hypothetical protein AVEN_273706-1 [Araneus ventricosus]
MSSANLVKEASSSSVLSLVKSGPDAIHFRRPASFSRVPITPSWLLVFLLFCSWKWSLGMTKKSDAVLLLVNLPPRNSEYDDRMHVWHFLKISNKHRQPS